MFPSGNNGGLFSLGDSGVANPEKLGITRNSRKEFHGTPEESSTELQEEFLVEATGIEPVTSGL